MQYNASSFNVDHTCLQPGVYVTKKTIVLDGKVLNVDTLDVRFCKPNSGELVDTAVLHAIEHIWAEVLRALPFEGKELMYVGPMGCQTGFYIVYLRTCEFVDYTDLIKFLLCRVLNGERIPGATIDSCGNYRNMDLDGAKILSRHFLDYLDSHQGSFSINT